MNLSRKAFVGNRPLAELSQNFLVDGTVAGRIVAAFSPAPGDHVLEVGPGRGALTDLVAGRVARLVAVELDRRLASELRVRARRTPGVEIVVADVLGAPFADLAGPVPPAPPDPGRPATVSPGLRILANLPYHISSPFVLKLLEESDSFSDALVLFQSEFAERVSAAPGGRTYGSLTVLVQCRLAATSLFDVPPRAFHPRPSVVSRLVRLVPLARPLVSRAEWGPLKALLRAAFSARRKTLANSLSSALGRPREAIGAILADAGIDARARAETVPPETWAALARDSRLRPSGSA